MAKATYSKPASQVDLEERQKKDYVPPTVVGKAVDPQKSENGYVGVDPIYQNAASATELPVKADKGPEVKVFEEFVSEEAEYPEVGDDEDDADETEGEDDAETTTNPSGPSNPFGN